MEDCREYKDDRQTDGGGPQGEGGSASLGAKEGEHSELRLQEGRGKKTFRAKTLRAQGEGGIQRGKGVERERVGRSGRREGDRYD